MPRIELDLKPLEHITVDAIGKPGARVFYLQGWRKLDPQPVTLLIEKVQLMALTAGVEQLLADLAKQKPTLLTLPAEYDEAKMRIAPPVDPLFRAGEMGLGYDADADMVVIILEEVLLEGRDEAERGIVRFWCSREQASRVAAWGKVVAGRGRPLCPQCGQPMEPEGHFCPKKNGHRH
jgi:uncharacterized repeat protein (TIGR03847 family)